jgi:hypothetical protein
MMNDAFYRVMQFLGLRKRAYQFTFKGPHGNAVLQDLMKFCRYRQVPFHADRRMTDIMIGRQEVLFRILNHLTLNEDQLNDLYNSKGLIQ